MALAIRRPNHGPLAYRMVWYKLVLKESIVTRDNYSYKKYQKELARKNKVEEKKQRKLEKKAIEATPESGQHPA